MEVFARRDDVQQLPGGVSNLLGSFSADDQLLTANEVNCTRVTTGGVCGRRSRRKPENQRSRVNPTPLCESAWSSAASNGNRPATNERKNRLVSRWWRRIGADGTAGADVVSSPWLGQTQPLAQLSSFARAIWRFATPPSRSAVIRACRVILLEMAGVTFTMCDSGTMQAHCNATTKPPRRSRRSSGRYQHLS